MLTPAVLKSYLLDMPRGHVFELTDALFADVFPPARSDAASRDRLQALAEECNCSIVEAEGRFDLIRR